MITAKDNEINVFSCTNDFIDVTFIIEGGKEKFSKACEVLEDAVDDWFDDDNEDAIGTCYGDYFQFLLDREDIHYTTIFHDKRGQNMKIKIFQKKDPDLGFHNKSDADREAEELFMQYKNVYEGNMIFELETNNIPVEDFIYKPEAEFIFNTFQHGISENIPKDYKGRSLSSGDIVGIQFDNEVEMRYYYCMSIGFYEYKSIKTRYLNWK